MGVLNTILDPILGLLTLLLFPNNYMNSGVGNQSYVLSRISYMEKFAVSNTAAQSYSVQFVSRIQPKAMTGISNQDYILMLMAFLRISQGSAAQQYYNLIQQAMLATGAPMVHGVSQDNYTVSVKVTYIPDPNKTTVLANGEDAVMFTDLPVPSHWITQQMGYFGARNEFDLEDPSFEATFYPPGQYQITISAPGYAEQTWMIDAIEDPSPPPDEEPEE